MRRTEDGFVIAEEDLKLRGGGEVLGTRQSGLPAFRIASLPEHGALLEAARDEARLKLTRSGNQVNAEPVYVVRQQLDPFEDSTVVVDNRLYAFAPLPFWPWWRCSFGSYGPIPPLRARSSGSIF